MKEGTWHCKYVLRYHNKTLGDPLLKGVLSLHTFPLTVTPSGPRKCHRKQGVTLSGVTVSGEVCICKTHRIFAWAPSRSFPFKAQSMQLACKMRKVKNMYLSYPFCVEVMNTTSSKEASLGMYRRYESKSKIRQILT